MALRSLPTPLQTHRTRWKAPSSESTICSQCKLYPGCVGCGRCTSCVKENVKQNLGPPPCDCMNTFLYLQALEEGAQLSQGGETLPNEGWDRWEVDLEPPSLECPFGKDQPPPGGSCMDCGYPIGYDRSGAALCSRCLETPLYGFLDSEWKCESCNRPFTSIMGIDDLCQQCRRLDY